MNFGSGGDSGGDCLGDSGGDSGGDCLGDCCSDSGGDCCSVGGNPRVSRHHLPSHLQLTAFSSSSPLLLAPTGALIVTVVYYNSI